MTFRRIQSVLYGVLCCSVVNAALAAEQPASPQPDRALHVLNRFVFGPRPGDVALVKAMGVDRWFEQQLHPDSINDSALDLRLQEFPAMAMPLHELMQEYPTPAQIRRLSRSGEALPQDPVQHALYADGVAFYEMAQQRKADKGNEGSPMQVQAAQERTTAGRLEAQVDRMSPAQVQQLAAAEGSPTSVAGNESYDRRRALRDAHAPGYRVEAAASGSDDGLLAEPLQCVSAEKPG